MVRKRQSFLDQALGHLQYQRELSRLHLLHTQVPSMHLAKEICVSDLVGASERSSQSSRVGQAGNHAWNQVLIILS